MPFDGGDYRLRQHHSGWAHGAVAFEFDAIAFAFCNGFEIGARTELSTISPKDRHPGAFIGIERTKRARKLFCRVAVHCVSSLWTTQDDGRDSALGFDANGHGKTLAPGGMLTQLQSHEMKVRHSAYTFGRRPFMTKLTGNFAAFETKMRAEGLPDIVIRSFEHYYRQLTSGETGLIRENAIQPAEKIPDAEALAPGLEELGRAALPKTVMIKLNGGLGTSMGLDKAKSLLTVKEGFCFLDLIARQALGSGVPLVLMNSFSTSADSVAWLSRYPELSLGPVPLEFVQNKVPKVLVDSLAPACHPNAPELEWCPPGHGDLYTAIATTGILDQMLAKGYEYLFVSNADNLGAVMDVSLLGHFVSEGLSFMMEVADRTPADRKGGHLAADANGHLLLRESAQCAEEDQEQFQDIERHKYFNTNNLWIHLPSLKQTMEKMNQVLGLAMIRNKKTLDPRDSSSPAVFQLETAMGAAIAVFDRAGAVRVPRSRFAPVKTTSDLLAIRSDAFALTSDARIEAVCAGPAPVVSLDPAYYKLIDDLELRFPHGPPSLVDCRSLEVHGDVRFGANIRCIGDVRISNTSETPLHIEDDSVLGA